MTSLLTERRLRSWLSGAVLTTWSLTRSNPWRWTSGETPLLSPTHHHEQHFNCSGVIQIPGHHNLSGPEVGQSHWVHCEKGPAEVVLPLPGEEVQPATGAADSVLLCHHWIHPLNVNNCLVQLSYQIIPQKTMEGSPDCWTNHWYNPLQAPRTLLIQSEQKGWQNYSGPLTSMHTLSLYGYRLVDATELWSPERLDTETVSSLRQSISWTLDIKRGTHNTIIQLFFHQITTYLYFSFQICTFQSCTHNWLYCILCFCYFVHYLFVYCYFVVCVLSCCCHSVVL